MLRNKAIAYLFVVFVAVVAILLPLGAQQATTGTTGAKQTVQTLPPDLVSDRFAVVGGKVTFTPGSGTTTPSGTTTSGMEGQANSILRSLSGGGHFIVGWIEYGTGDLNKTSPLVILDFDQNETKEYRIVLNELQANTSYKYRAAAVSIFGIARGNTLELRTSGSGTGTGGFTLQATPTEVRPGDDIAVKFETPNSVNSKIDWIGMFEVGDDDRSYRRFEYTAGKQSGELSFKASDPGLYEFRYFTNNTFSRAAVSNQVRVLHPGGKDYTITLDRDVVKPGEQIKVSFTAPDKKNKHHWIGLYPVNADDKSYLTFKYTNGADQGTLTFTAPPHSGEYNFRYFTNNGYHRVAVSNNFRVSTDGGGSTFAPRASTTPATSLGLTSARLNGTINPNGNPTKAWFEWGTAHSALTQSTTQQSVGNASSTVVISHTLSGLQSGTTYFFRAAAQNAHGTTRGMTLSFKTSGTGTTTTSTVPMATTRPATSITATSVRLNGDVTPSGTNNMAWFEWGTSTSSLVRKTNERSFSGSMSFGETITGLTPNTNYYYRVAARNANGTVHGSTLSSRTLTTNTSTGTTTTGMYLLTVNPRTIEPGDSVTVRFERPTTSNSSAADWIGLYLMGDNDQSYRTYQYTSGRQSGELNFRIDAAGTYEFRYFSNNTFMLRTTSESVTVQPGGTGDPTGFSMTVSQSSVQPRKTVSVSFQTPSTHPNSAKDWIGMYRTGASDREYVTWKYTNGSNKGTMSFTAPSSEGAYEFRYFLNNGYTRAGKSNTFTVNTGAASAAATGTSELSADGHRQTSSSPNPTPSPSTVGTTTRPGDTLPSRPGTAPSGTTTTGPGSVPDTGPRPNGPSSTGTTTVLPNGDNFSYALIITESRIRAGESVEVTYSGTPNTRDWIGVYREGASDRQYTSWQYVQRGGSKVNFKIQRPGTYEFRYFIGNGYERAAVSTVVAVE